MEPFFQEFFSQLGENSENILWKKQKISEKNKRIKIRIKGKKMNIKIQQKRKDYNPI